MSIDITNELKRTFDLADMRHKTKGFRKAEDWEKGRTIMERHERQAAQVTEAYYAQYDTRVSQALHRLIETAGTPKKTLTNRFFQTDQFNKDLLLSQAHKDVQQDHHRRMTKIEEQEAGELGALIETIARRDAKREELKQSFKRSADKHPAKVPLKNQPRSKGRSH